MKKKIKLSRILLIALILIITLSELFLRLFYYEQLKTRQSMSNKIPDSLLVFNRKPNTLEICNTPGVYNVFKSNNMGYVGHDFNKDKDSGVFRIILIGSSNTVGTHLSSTNNATNYLQRLCFANNMKVEIINCGREGGQRDIQNLYAIKKEIIFYKPDLILLENSGNIVYRRYVYEGYKNYSIEYDPAVPQTRAQCVNIVNNLYKYRFITFFYDISYIIRAISKKYIELNSNWDLKALWKRNSKLEIYLYSYIRNEAKVYLPDYNITWSYMEKEYKDIASKLNTSGCKLVIFSFGEFNQALRDFFTSNDINFIELRMHLFRELPLNSKLEGHFNEIGNAILAQSFFSQLFIHNYIPKKFLK